MAPELAAVHLIYAISVAKPLPLFVEPYGKEKDDMPANDITNVIKIVFDCDVRSS